jgi:hypothetical protein
MNPLPRILFVGRWDWANLCNRIARAINAYAGEELARVATENAHPFGYRDDIVISRDGLDVVQSIAQSADWLVTTGDGDYDFLRRLLRELPLKRAARLAATHAGTAYRNDSRRMNRWDAELGVRIRFIGSDSWNLARQGPPAVPYFGTCDLAPQLRRTDGLPRVTHSPSSRATKGSQTILPVLSRLEAEGTCSVDLIEGVPATEALERRHRADVHIDQINPAAGGFGQSAIEAMGVGCAVLCDVRHIAPAVWRFYPPPPILDVRNAHDLESWLRVLLRDLELLNRYREMSYAWSRANSAPDCVARYWLLHLHSASVAVPTRRSASPGPPRPSNWRRAWSRVVAR